MRLFLFLFLLLPGGSIYAQRLLTPKVVVSGGNFASNGGYNISSSVGESVVQTFYSSGFYLTQGFQQPSLFIGNKREVNNSGTSIEVYPNPVEDKLILEISAGEINKFFVEVYTLTGIKLQTHLLKNLLSATSIKRLDFSGYANGTYFVHIFCPDKQINRVFVIVKM
jgi:hypothetical protein